MDIYSVGLGNSGNDARKRASQDYVKFWEGEANNLHWFEKWGKALEWNPPFARWFVGGKINACFNALDVPAKKSPKKTAILWEGENGDRRSLTYQDLLNNVCKAANVLKSLGVQKGDRVTVYLPMIPELVISLLACARIGAIHTVIFSGFSAQSIRDRVIDSKSKVIITADGGFRRGRSLSESKW